MRQRASSLTIALSKGKLFEPAMDLLARVGLISRKISGESRRVTSPWLVSSFSSRSGLIVSRSQPARRVISSTLRKLTPPGWG